jgi:hypothetical protein
VIVRLLQQHGLPNAGSADAVDPDDDQFHHWHEWRAGTDPSLTNLHDRFSLANQFKRRFELSRKDFLESRFCGIAAGEPDDVGWRSETAHPLHEIRILCQQRYSGPSRGIPNVRSLSFTEAEIPERRRDAELKSGNSNRGIRQIRERTRS